jgi:tetratricopeptide (TPR) repeat protein
VHCDTLAEARNAERRLLELRQVADRQHETLFARVIQVLQLDLAAWILDAEGRPDSGIALMNQAAKLEAATPKPAVTPAPTLPAYEQLGDLLFLHKKFHEALNAYRRSLETNPRRFNSLLGAARASRGMDSTSTASMFYRQLIEISNPKSNRESLQEARSFLAR